MTNPYKRFEDLPVWQLAVRIFEQCDSWGGRASSISPTLRHQLSFVALSISNHIAESFERGSKPEILAAIQEAAGAARQTRSMVCVLQRTAWSAEMETELAELKISAESCGRQLRAWSEVIQRTSGAEPTAVAVSSPERFQRLLATLPATHPLRQTETD
jgi:four helix bundle protein